MATKQAMDTSLAESLTKGFCTGCGFHLGVVQPRPWAIKNQGHWDLLVQQFSELLSKGWAYGELDTLIKDAGREKLMLRRPDALVDGRVPASRRKDPARNLVACGPARERLFYHPELVTRGMPCLTLDQDHTVLVEDEGFRGEFAASYTLADLARYWADRVGEPARPDELRGGLLWCAETYGLATVLHAVDRMAAAMGDVRSPWERSQASAFDLKPYAVQVEKDREEADRWS